MAKKLQEKEYLKSTDLNLCATLCCYGYKIEKVIRDNPSRVIFEIEIDKKIDDLIKRYFAHQLTVEPVMLFGFLRA